MPVSAFEGVVEHGQIKLRENVTLPENTRVLVVIPDFEKAPIAHIHSPRLKHPENAEDFTKQVIEVHADV